MPYYFARTASFALAALGLATIASSQDAGVAAASPASPDSNAPAAVEARAEARQRVVEELKAQVEQLRSQGETLEGLDKLGDLYLQLGDVQRAVVAYERAIKNHGGTEQLYYKLATSLLLGRRPELGLKILQIATEAYPDSARLLAELGRAYNGLGKQYAAVATLTKAAELEPENEVIQYHLADAYRSQRKWGEAEAIIDTLIESGSDFLPARLMKADLLLAQDNARRAVRLLEDLREEHPQSPDIKRVLKHAYQQYAQSEAASGRLSRAVKALESALELFPEDAETVASLGTIHYEAGEHEAAETRFRQLTESFPDYLDGYALYGTLLRIRDRKEEARTQFAQGLERARAANQEEEAKRFQDLLSSL